jgi:hypothetical protein
MKRGARRIKKSMTSVWIWTAWKYNVVGTQVAPGRLGVQIALNGMQRAKLTISRARDPASERPTKA